MSGPAPGNTDERQYRGVGGPMGFNFTEEEKKMIEECDQESFWYRSLPFSAVSMGITQILVARGSLTASPRFGSLPKVAFAGLCGYLFGKISYAKTCQEKFKRNENSPFGAMLRERAGMPRERAGMPQQYSKGPQSEVGNVDTSMQYLGTMFQSEAQSKTPPQSGDYGFGYSPEPPISTERKEDLSVPDQSYTDEEKPRKKPISYEDLRIKNRENYEVTFTQKAETLLPPREPERSKKEVKKNIYGDTWEE